MNRWNFLLAVGLSTVLSMPGQSSAAGISIVNVSSTGASPSTLARGDRLTIDLVAHNEGHLDIYGFGMIAYGYDVDIDGLADDGLAVVGVSAASSIFNTTHVPSVGSFGGLPNFAGTRDEYPAYGPNRVDFYGLITVMFKSVSLTPSNGDGSLDVGLNGGLISDGDVHMRIVFQAQAVPNPVDMTLTFGAHGGPGWPIVGVGGALLPFENDTFDVRILANPEPTTAMLIGLGLLGLGLARPRPR